ncbi:hypothetical protein [Micromonospora arborensis]|uniref:hypothetical protein n=1 Tax=Micromonospora arborensis TaxID=2116518 RepID=UPI00371183DE
MLDREELSAAGHAAHRHTAGLEREIQTEYPGIWQSFDQLRKNPPAQWPDWCLLPMAAPASLVANMGEPKYPATIAAMSAIYAWRYARSVYLVEPALLQRLLTAVPDALDGVDELADLPQWCVYVAEANPSGFLGGVWMHLEYDINTGRPELRLLLDTAPELGLAGLLPLPLYLDRANVTEAIGDYLATGLASIGRTGANVRGGELDASVAQLAERVDGYLALARYLSRQEADVQSLTVSSAKPRRYRSPVKDKEIWLVGYGDA